VPFEQAVEARVWAHDLELTLPTLARIQIADQDALGARRRRSAGNGGAWSRAAIDGRAFLPRPRPPMSLAPPEGLYP
jgi:hypothetical protein